MEPKSGWQVSVLLPGTADTVERWFDEDKAGDWLEYVATMKNTFPEVSVISVRIPA